ncbi:hypothetical protein X732_30300 [Mesorhizobium sp. L2C066B000]|nr:hypothetical protein X732_30300 [Mesorhizobium sp. L2C066B000]
MHVDNLDGYFGIGHLRLWTTSRDVEIGVYLIHGSYCLD